MCPLNAHLNDRVSGVRYQLPAPDTRYLTPFSRMNESTQNQLLEVLRETPRARAATSKRASTIGIRVSPGGYFAVAALLTFVAVILLRTQRDLAALTLVVATWLVTPILVATDRIYFDGETLFRSGLVPLLSRVLRAR